MADIDSRIAGIKKTIESAKITKIRAEAAREQAELRKAEALQALQDKFGLDNLAQARAKLAELKSDLEVKVSEIENKLKNF